MGFGLFGDFVIKKKETTISGGVATRFLLSVSIGEVG